MGNADAYINLATLIVIIGGMLLVRRSLEVIHQNVNSNLSTIREENENLNEEVRKLLGREHSLEMLQEATERRAEEAERRGEETQDDG